MAGSNGSFDLDCDLDWYLAVGSRIEIPAYYIVIPICLFLGAIGRILCLVAFYFQSKKEPAYTYQIALTTSEFSELLSGVGYCMVMICLWNPNGSAVWYQSNYALMWFAAHLAVPLCNMCYLTSGLLSISMAADRVLAISRPVMYKNMNHSLLRTASIVVSVTLGVGTSVFDCFRYSNPQKNPDSEGVYYVEDDLVYMESTIAKALSWIRDALRLCALAALILLNIALVRVYLKHSRHIAKMTGQTAEARREKRKAKGEMTLGLLALFQVLFRFISTFAVSTYYIVLSSRPTFDLCESLLWSPILDAVMYLTNVADFYVILLISKQFRRLIFEHIPCAKQTVGPVSQRSTTT